MGRHRSQSKNKKWASYATAGLALEVVSLFGFSYATDSHVGGVSLLATTVFVDGTKDILPNDPPGDERMRDTLGGLLDQCPGATCNDNIFVPYPRTMGVLTGLTDPRYDESKALATEAIKDAIRDNPGETIYVVGYSQGADAASDALRQLEHENATNGDDPDVDLSNVKFVLLGNPTRNDGGGLARWPSVYVPLLGIPLGGATNSHSATVIQISKQYDGISDVPKYVLNPVAWANTAMGFLYVHNHYYRDVDFLVGTDTNHDGEITDAELNQKLAGLDPDDYIVTRSENGKVIDVLIKNPEGQLPLTRPLLDHGVPQEVVTALDPLLRALIEMGYDRPTNGDYYPSEPVGAELMPGPSQWPADFHAIAAGLEETMERLAALNLQNQADAIQFSQSTDVPGLRIEPAPEQLQGQHQLQVQTHTQLQTQEQVQTVAPAPADELRADQPPSTPMLPTNPAQTDIVRGPIGGSPSLPGLKRIATAVNGVVTRIAGALDAQPPAAGGSSTTSTTSPGTDTGTGDGGEGDGGEGDGGEGDGGEGDGGEGDGGEGDGGEGDGGEGGTTG